MTEITISGIHKWEIRHIDTDLYTVQFFEKMGERWVRIGSSYNCNKDFIKEEFELTEDEFHALIY